MLNFASFLETQRTVHKEILVTKDYVTDSFLKIEETGAAVVVPFFFRGEYFSGSSILFTHLSFMSSLQNSY